jgi:alpha-glucosidase
MQVVPEIDIKELVDYAAERNVGIILWAGYWALNRDIEGLCKHYSELGVKGWKVDFLDRDDQEMVRFVYDIAETAAKYHMLLDYHGVYKPTGLQRTYPNAINFEGVHGLETMKWLGAEHDQITYDVTIPFIRAVAGPMDYTPGAMTNRHRADFQKDYYHPMSMGTRCHQAAMFVLYDTALQMLCDSPSAYAKEPAYTHFLTSLPLLWDETIALPYSHPEGCLAVLRRRGNEWIFAVLNNDQARVITVPTWYLPEGDYLATALVDGTTITENAQAYHFEEHCLTPSNTMDIAVAAGGGCVVYMRAR